MDISNPRPLSIDERAKEKEEKGKALEKVADEIKRAKKTYIDDEAVFLAEERKVTVPEARKIVESRITPEGRFAGVLLGDDLLYFDHQGVDSPMAVWKALCDRETLDEKSLCDPREPEYGGFGKDLGWGKAKFFDNGDTGCVINSFAHRSHFFILLHSARSLVFALDFLEREKRLVTEWKWHVANARLDATELEYILKDLKDRLNLTLGALKSALEEFKKKRLVFEPGMKPTGRVREDATQKEIADAACALLRNEFGDWISSVGEFYTYTGQYWSFVKPETIGSFVADRYKYCDLCRRAGEYKAISKLVYYNFDAENFFDDAPAGLATPDGFYRCTDQGEICVVPNRPEHRQKFGLDFAPEQGPMPLFQNFLCDCFEPFRFGEPDDDDGDVSVMQRYFEKKLLVIQEIFGGVIFGAMAQHQRVALLLGRGQNGKSQLAQILEEFVAKEFLAALSPHEWGKPERLSALVHARLNVVGELPERKTIPSAEFKNVVGGDATTVRTLWHDPVRSIIHSAHIFLSNSYPKTNDHSLGFYRRWIILRFPNWIPDDRKIPNIAKKIFRAEREPILHWAMEGAARLKRQGQFTEIGDGEIKQWRSETDTVAAFFDGCSWVSLVPGAVSKGDKLFIDYKDWCMASGFERCCLRGTFYERVESFKNIRRITRQNAVYFKGVKVTENDVDFSLLLSLKKL